MRNRELKGCSLIKVAVQTQIHTLLWLEIKWIRAVVGRHRACALTAAGKRKDMRRRCQSQSMRSRGREGERARMAQMEPDKKGARASEARQRKRRQH